MSAPTSLSLKGLCKSPVPYARMLVGTWAPCYTLQLSTNAILCNLNHCCGAGMSAGFSKSVHYALEEIHRLPVVSTSSQELWLGILLRGPAQLAKHCSATNSDAPGAEDSGGVLRRISADLAATWTSLTDSCAELEVYLPPLSVWITEALLAREDIQQVKRSRVRTLLRELSDSADNDARNRVDHIAYSMAELISLLPDQPLRSLLRFEQQHNRPPQLEELESWLMCEMTCEALVVEAQQRATMARNIMVAGYLRYALRIARNYVDQGVDYADLAQEGFIGLIKAAEHFDYRIHARFATYATSWIWQSVGRAIADQGRTIRLPVHVHEQIRKLEEAGRQSTEGDVPHEAAADRQVVAPGTALTESAESDEDLTPSDSSGEDLDDARVCDQVRIQRLLEWAQPILSLDMCVPCSMTLDEEDNDITRPLRLVDMIDYLDDGGLQDVLDKPIVSMAIRRVMEVLKPRQREVLSLRFGLFDGRPHTLEEIGEQWGVTRERVRQIEATSFLRLRNPARAEGLKRILVDVPLGAGDRELPKLPPPICQHVDKCFGPRSRLRVEAEHDWYYWLDSEIANLPGGDWHRSRSDENIAHCEEIQAVFRLLGAPAHYSEVAEQLSAKSDSDSYTPSHIYSFLIQQSEAFLYLGEGVFTLVEWEQERSRQSAPVLPFCPTIPSDSGFQSDRFFEIAMLLDSLLRERPTLESAMQGILVWSNVEVDPPKWVVQSIVSSYYLIGLVPYLLYESDKGVRLDLCLPTLDVHSLRRYALTALNERLLAMPEFWWLFQRYQPIRLGDLGRHFAEVNGLGLDDVGNRLRMLTNIGAARRLPDGRFCLTSLGEEFADRLKRKPNPALSSDHDSDWPLGADDGLDRAELSVW